MKTMSNRGGIVVVVCCCCTSVIIITIENKKDKILKKKEFSSFAALAPTGAPKTISLPDVKIRSWALR